MAKIRRIRGAGQRMILVSSNPRLTAASDARTMRLCGNRMFRSSGQRGSDGSIRAKARDSHSSSRFAAVSVGAAL